MKQIGNVKNLPIYELDDDTKNMGFDNDNMITNGEYDIVRNFITRNNYIVDVGANKGYWSMMAISVANPELLVMFEPVPENQRIIHDNFFVRNNCKTIGMAVSNKSGKIKFRWYKNNTQMGEMSNMFGRPDVEKNLNLEVEELDVNTIALDEFLNINNIGVLDFLKIDSEGAELLVLQGAMDYIRNRNINYIQLEYGGCAIDSGATLKEEYDILTQWGYDVYRIIPNGLISIDKWNDELENYKHSNYFAIKKNDVSIAREMEDDLVSVIIPTYNRPDMLMRAIDSVRQQSYQNIEIIVCNDGGQDVSQIADPEIDYRIVYVNNKENKGLGANRNSGLSVAKGEWICYLDDDDYFYTNHITDLVNYAKLTESKVVYSTAMRSFWQKYKDYNYKIDGKDVPYNIPFDKDLLLVQNITPVLCVMHHKDCIEEGLFEENYAVYEDWIAWIKLSRKFKFEHLEKVTCEFTWKFDGTTMSSSKKEFSTLLPTIYTRFAEYANDEVKKKQSKIMNERGVMSL